MFKLTGTLKVIKDTVQISEKFSKREFVVSENSSMYPQEISFQAAQDKCSLLDSFGLGQEIEVSFNLRGRAWIPNDGSDTKYFNTLDAWRIEAVGGASVTPPPLESKQIDDLPF